MRSPERIARRHPNLKIASGDPHSLDQLTKAMEGHDAVLSALGVRPSAAFRPHPLVQDCAATVEAMTRTGVKRLVLVSAAVLFPIKGIVYGFFRWLLKHADCEPLSRHREALWPESSAAEHAQELAAMLASGRNGTMPLAIFVAETTGGALVGFLEVGLRSHADGCDSKTPVAFLEGLYVAEAFRRKGMGKQLLIAAENWARRQGCVEMASDTWIDHITSRRVHEALGFEVVDRCVHYRQSLR